MILMHARKFLRPGRMACERLIHLSYNARYLRCKMTPQNRRAKEIFVTAWKKYFPSFSWHWLLTSQFLACIKDCDVTVHIRSFEELQNIAAQTKCLHGINVLSFLLISSKIFEKRLEFANQGRRNQGAKKAKVPQLFRWHGKCPFSKAKCPLLFCENVLLRITFYSFVKKLPFIKFTLLRPRNTVT